MTLRVLPFPDHRVVVRVDSRRFKQLFLALSTLTQLLPVHSILLKRPPPDDMALIGTIFTIAPALKVWMFVALTSIQNKDSTERKT
jgi:hypothetical protein